VSIYATLWTLKFPEEGDALRGNRATVAAEVFLPDGTHRILQTPNRPLGNPGASEPEPPKA
jgi:hypothetical protein